MKRPQVKKETLTDGPMDGQSGLLSRVHATKNKRKTCSRHNFWKKLSFVSTDADAESRSSRRRRTEAEEGVDDGEGEGGTEEVIDFKFEFFDPGNHFCRKCHTSHETIYQFLDHLHSKKHFNVSCGMVTLWYGLWSLLFPEYRIPHSGGTAYPTGLIRSHSQLTPICKLILVVSRRSHPCNSEVFISWIRSSVAQIEPLFLKTIFRMCWYFNTFAALNS